MFCIATIDKDRHGVFAYSSAYSARVGRRSVEVRGVSDRILRRFRDGDPLLLFSRDLFLMPRRPLHTGRTGAPDNEMLP